MDDVPKVNVSKDGNVEKLERPSSNKVEHPPHNDSYLGKPNHGKGYDSFVAFKKDNPVKTKGNQWHHIVEQCQMEKSGFNSQMINNTDNLIELTPAQHKEITRIYSSITSYSEGVRVRDWLAGKSFELQYQFGIGKLKELGIMK